MKNQPPFGVAIVLASLLLVSPGLAQEQASAGPSNNDAIGHHMEELEEQVKELRAEVTALKGSDKPATPATPAPAPGQSNLVTSAAAPGAAPAAPSLAGLLGPTTLSGFVDVYYGQNFNNPTSQTNGLRFFDAPTNQFGLNLVELVVDKTPDPTNSRTGYHIALGFGQAMNVVNGSEPRAGLGFDQYLKEAYFSYLAPVGKGLQVDVGKFVTPMGAEVIESKDNWNYSRGLLFTWAIPFYHFGARAKYTFNDKYNVTGFVLNGWNNIVDNNSGKTYGFSFVGNPTKTASFIVNYLAGPEEATGTFGSDSTGTLVNVNKTWRQTVD